METTEAKKKLTPATERVERWEEETLQKVLEKTPERKHSFEGVSLEPVERLYTDADTENLDESAFPANFRTNAAFIRPAIAASSGRCASLPVFRRLRKRTHGLSI